MILINNKLYDFIFDILPKLTGCFDKPLRQRRTGKTVKEDFFVSVTHDLRVCCTIAYVADSIVKCNSKVKSLFNFPMIYFIT